MPSFFDTNIFLYAGSNAAEDQSKRDIAQRLIENVDYVISTQVLQEFIANALRKKQLGLQEDSIAQLLDFFTEEEVIPLTLSLIKSANLLRTRYQISSWDSTIIAAAQSANCQTLYTEDLNHGQDYGGVKAINPFLV